MFEFRRALVAVSAFCLAPFASAIAQPACPASGGFEYMGVPISFSGDQSAYYFATDHKLVDADGAPNAYHPDDTPNTCPATGRGIDCLAAAGYPDGSWWQTVLVADPQDPTRPAIQKDGRYKGYFVSMTSLRNTDFAGPANTASYVDASHIPYVVLPAPIYRTDGMGEMGDIGWAINLDTGRSTPFVIADEGPIEPLGEASVAFWQALGVRAPNPRDGQGLPEGRIAYVVFPGSRHSAAIGWPIDRDALTRDASARLAALGGVTTLRSCTETGEAGLSAAR